MRRRIDHDQVRLTYAILDPLCSAPARQRSKVKADRLCPEPRPPQLDPRREVALRIDVESRDPCAAPRPGNRELGGERRFAGAALALCNRDDRPRHSTCALAEAGGGW